MTWQNTPYVHAGSIKGAGVDCLMLLVRSAQNCGLIPTDIKIPRYSRQFNLHRSAETYLDGLLGHMREVEKPEPGDIALWKFGRCFAHAALVIDWPTVIHANTAAGIVSLDDVDTTHWLKYIDHKGAGRSLRPVKYLSLW